MRIEHVTIIVDDYDAAIDFFTQVLDFDLVEDSAATGTDGNAKRWVVVRPADGGTGLVLARAQGATQTRAIGHQFAGRVEVFLRVRDVEDTLRRVRGAGCELVRPPRRETYGDVAVFRDPWGNLWDLLSGDRRS